MPLYRCIECIVERLYNSVCLLLITFMLKSYTLIHIFFNMFFKSCIGFVLSNCLNAKKKYIWNTKYTIQHSIVRSQTAKYIPYNIHDTKVV